MALYRIDLFYRRLMLQSGFWADKDYVGIYAQGVPAFPDAAIGLALADSKAASHQILVLTSELESLLASYESGALTQEQFQHQFRAHLDQIGDLSKQIRGDDYLDYLDPRRSQKGDSFSKANSIQGMRSLVADLRGLAMQMKSGIESYQKEDRAKVVSVQELGSPSFATISKSISNLTRSLEKSAKGL